MMMTAEAGLPEVAPLMLIQYEELVRRELAADLGAAGDITTGAIVRGDVQATARVVARHEGRVCGLDCTVFAFRLLGGVRHRVRTRRRHRTSKPVPSWPSSRAPLARSCRPSAPRSTSSGISPALPPQHGTSFGWLARRDTRE